MSLPTTIQELALELESAFSECGDFKERVVSAVSNHSTSPFDLPSEIARISTNFGSNENESKSSVRDAFERGITRDVERLLEPSIFEVFGGDDRITFRCAEKLFDAVPIAAYRLAALIKGSLDGLDEFERALERDGSQLESIFGFNTHDIRYARRLAGDPHAGQRRPILIVDRSGRRVVFKPRSLEPEIFVSHVLGCLISPEIRDVVKVPPTITDDNHGWMEFVEHAPPDPVIAARGVGVLLGLVSTVQLNDLHAENVIPNSRCLYVVDAETVLIPSIDDANQFTPITPSMASILPDPNGYGLRRWWDITLTGSTPYRWTVPSHFRYVCERGSGIRSARLVNHRISLRDSYVARALKFLDEESLMQSTGASFDAVLDNFVDSNHFGVQPALVSRRFLYRNTAVYMRTLFRLTDPVLMSTWESMAQELLPYISTERSADIQLEEIRLLARCDVPRFTGVDIERLVGRPAENISVDRDAARGAVELGVKLIARVDRPIVETGDAMCTGSPAERLTWWAKEAISNMKAPSVGSVEWRGIVPSETCGRATLGPIDFSIYNGLSGIALALAMSAQFTGDELLSEMARNISLSAVEAMERGDPLAIDKGPGGILFVLSALRRVGISWVAPLVERAASLALEARPNPEYDVLSGMAGSLLLLLSIAPELRDARWGRVTERLMSEIISGQSVNGGWPALDTQGLCGFAHGASGIRYAIARASLGGVSFGLDLDGPIRLAATFEDGYFNKRRHNWQDLRPGVGREPQLAAWCTGSVGIGLAEVGLAKLGLKSESWRIQEALYWPTQPSTLECYCCGRGGQFELSVLAAANGVSISERSTVNSAPRANTRFMGSEIISLFRGPLGTALVEAINTGPAAAPFELGLFWVEN